MHRNLTMIGLAAILSLLLAIPATAKPRVVILGFDGVDPGLTDTMIAAGKLPNLAKLKTQGLYKRLRSTTPPESPVAWSSFSTCVNPGNHGVFDFLGRDPKLYAPKIGFGDIEYPVLAPDGSVRTPVHFVSERQGEAFWIAADKQGARSTVLHVPFAFPPDPLEHGEMLCGLGVPDVRGTMNASFFMSDSFTPKQLSESMGGGARIPLRFNGATAEVTISTVSNANPARPGFIPVSFRVSADRAAHKVTLELPGKSVTTPEHAWSEWIEWDIAVSPKYSVRAISRVYVIETGEQVRIYMTCLQQHPKAPDLAFSAPTSYSGAVADRYGLYKTVGWSFDTFAVRRDELPEDVFLDDVAKTSAWMEQLTLDELDRDKSDILIAAWTGTDRVAHLFWRFRDPEHPLYTADGAKKYGHAVEDTYAQMDEIVGKVMGKLRADDLLMILSDHGFHSFRTGFSVNTFLVRNGYLGLKGQADPATAHSEKVFMGGFDWGLTKAYNVGLGAVFLNLKGREAQGTITPEQAPALIAELKQKLLEIKDPGTGKKVFSAIYTSESFAGKAKAGAPDLQLAYAEGFQTSKGSARGEAPQALFEPNTDKWSGEHAASDAADTPGIFFCNRALANAADPAIIDLGPTALDYLGLKLPANFEGKSLTRAK